MTVQEINLGARRIKMISRVEVRKMLDHARKQYVRTIMPKDADFWRKRIQVLEAEFLKPPSPDKFSNKVN